MKTVPLQKRYVIKNVGYKTTTQSYSIETSKLVSGVNLGDDYLIYKRENDFRIYDRVCNHSAGKLISRPGARSVICPMHGWVFNPETGKYTNVGESKDPIPYIEENGALNFSMQEIQPVLETFNQEKETTIEFLNHACIIVNCGDLSFATDPWLIGPAFCDGWWLALPTAEDAFEKINSCDFIYISHNHPDHLHPLTLERVNKNIPVLTPNFKTKSTENYLRSLGFTNIHALDFGSQMVFGEESVALTIYKSGDFRDDSGLHFCNGNFEALLTVDSNFINFLRLPQQIDLLAASFAAGASGYPLCFDMYDDRMKEKIVTRNRNAIRATNEVLIQKAQPKFYMPYAGFFKEKAPRDSYIERMNIKNCVEDYEDLCSRYSVTLLNVTKNRIPVFSGKKMVKAFTPDIPNLQDKNLDAYIQDSKNRYSTIEHSEIISYFKTSRYKDNLILFIKITDDDFGEVYETVKVDFRHDDILVEFVGKANLDAKTEYEKNQCNILLASIRQIAFNQTIKERLLWEDISIGFQARFLRVPDVYNSSFWHHFTNVHIKENAARAIMECGSCNRIQQKMDKSYA